MNLKELLKDWEDQDVSAYYLACCLGVVNYDDSFAEFRKFKHIFWTSNTISNFLYKMLGKMSEAQILEFDEIKGKYRWNQKFNP